MLLLSMVIFCGFARPNGNYSEKGEIYNWGRGEYGVFGDGSNKSLKTPHFNENFERMKVDEKLSVVTMKSCNNYSVALMSKKKPRSYPLSYIFLFIYRRWWTLWMGC